MIDLVGDWDELAKWCPPSGTKDVGKLIYGFAQHINATRTLEIGVYRGYVSIILGVHARSVGGMHFAIDNDYCRLETLSTIAAERKLNINGFYVDSKDLLNIPDIMEGGFHIIFVDGDHRLPRCLEDIRNSLSLVSVNGCVFIHDYNSPPPNEVRKAIEIVEEEGLFSSFYTMPVNGLFMAVRRKEQ